LTRLTGFAGSKITSFGITYLVRLVWFMTWRPPKSSRLNFAGHLLPPLQQFHSAKFGERPLDPVVTTVLILPQIMDRNRNERRMNREKFMDMSVVVDPKVKSALGEIFSEWHERKRWNDFPPEVKHVHRHILRQFLHSGHPPSRAQLAALPVADINVVLADLCSRDLVVLNDAGEISGAYPFSANPTRHAVFINGNTIGAMCAIDALGTGAMAGQDCQVTSRCPACEETIRIKTGKLGLAINEVRPETAIVWAGVNPIDCAANTECQSVVMFCSEDHLARWRHTSNTIGVSLSMTQALQAGAAIFRPFLAS